MTVQSLAYAAMAVGSIDDALPNLEALGLPILDRTEHPALGGRVALLGTGHGAVALLEPAGDGSPVAAFLADRGQGLHHVALQVDEIVDEGHGPGWARRGEGVRGQSALLSLAHGGHLIELVETEYRSSPEETAWRRVESIVWSAADRSQVASEMQLLLGLGINEEHSNLLFPDLQSTNTMLMTGRDSYIDVNEPTDVQSATAKRLAAKGNSMFAIVLEPWDFDATCERLKQRGVPTVTEAPIDLRAVFPDGSNRSAARIWSLDRKFTAGTRIFVSEPTFPWDSGEPSRTLRDPETNLPAG